MTNATKTQPKICSICGDYYQGLGNDAWSIKTGRCCDPCNNIVVTARINNLGRGSNPYAAPEWYCDLLSQTSEQLVRPLQAQPDQ